MRVTSQKFAMVPEEVIVDKRISLAAKGLYAYIMFSKNPDALTIKGVSLDLRENEDRVSKAAYELYNAGYVENVK